MDQIENKHWAMLAGFALMGFSFWWLNHSWTSEVSVKGTSLSYEMPRPKEEGSEYDLSGRRMVHNLTEAERRILEKKAEAPVAVPKVSAEAQAKLIAQKAAADKKKKEAAKKAAANSKRKAQLGVRIADAEGFSRSGDLSPLSDSTESSRYSYSLPRPPIEEPGIALPKENKDDEPKKTAEEWRALLLSDPKQVKNAVEFHQAFKSGELTSEEFYQIADSLLADPSADRKNLALSILKLEPSVKTFSVLVSHYTEKTSQELRTQIYAILKTYGDLPRFSTLVQLFSSRNTRVVALAAEVLKATLTAQTQLTKEAGDRSRSPGAAVIAPESFAIFRPVLSRLAEAGDPAAKTLLASIEALMTEARTA